MASVDSSAVWLIQAWPFYNERSFWGADQMKVRQDAVCIHRHVFCAASQHKVCRTHSHRLARASKCFELNQCSVNPV